MAAEHQISFLVVAGGRGSRAGEGLPKQYRALGGMSVLARTLAALNAAAPGFAVDVLVHDACFVRGAGLRQAVCM